VRDGSPLVDVGEGGATRPVGLTRTVELRLSAGDKAGTLSDTVIDRRYQIRRRLGEGGMAYVYLAIDMEDHREVAVKVLSPKLATDENSMARLRREAELAMRLDHPHICPIYRLGETPDGLRYLVMPYLEGETLSDIELAHGPIELADGVPLLMQICRGLHHAHGEGVLHRDLKPENVMLVGTDPSLEKRRAVVMDFGLAKELRASREMMRLTSAGVVLGTPEFMSPEQIRGKELDPRSDVYAVGVLAFEMFTGELPFTGESPQDMMIARLRGEPRLLRAVRPTLSAKLEEVIARSLAREREDRYPSIEAFAADVAGTEHVGLLQRLFGR